MKRRQSLSKNCIESDIEIEDDIIFGNDDNDSLSSAGICHATTTSKGSHSTLVISNQNKSITNLPPVNIQDIERVRSSQILVRPRSLSNTHYLAEPVGPLKLSSSMDNNCMRLARLEPATSISDIDPDENILKNLLIKNANKNQ